ncbi:MAG: hydrogenase formation protein HypD [Planctomycetes bacterium]|nr:hydrogenase formation protein HypD [Planctomycetota bacterium]
MRFVDEYRRSDVARGLVAALREAATRRWTIMEVCGGQTHAILRAGLDELLEGQVELVHGPGCPVCVTPVELIDQAHAIAATPGVVFTSFGDMLRVPGSQDDLLRCRGRGADVRVVYAPLDALRLARELPGRQVVFFAVGFETTAPATAVAVQQARRLGVENFSVLCAHVRVPPAIAAVLERPASRVQGFLGPGHVCTVVGLEEYRALTARYRVPIVVTGFEPVDLLDGLLRCVRQLEAGRHEVENQYARVVPDGGNPRSLELVADVFAPVTRPWRGIGPIPEGALRLSDAYADFDAARRFEVAGLEARESPVCISGRVLAGDAKPTECPAFGTDCTPERPLGATMVSAEGACAAYHAYGRR